MWTTQQNKENNEVISETIGYPYNIIPKGYPNKISSKQVEITNEKILNHLKGNAGVDSIVQKDTALLSLGVNELNGRKSMRQFWWIFSVSILSFVVSVIAVIISILSVDKLI